jgi:hypothetical protein
VIVVLLAVLGLLGLLVIRFVAPELFYEAREAVMELRFQRLFLRRRKYGVADRGKVVQLLSQVSHFETKLSDPPDVFRRVAKIRELYYLCDQRRTDIPVVRNLRRPQVCIIELAAITKNQAENLRDANKVQQPSISAEEILAFLAGSAFGKDRSATAIDTQEWLMKNELSTEQVIELLLAVVIGFASNFTIG